ncbi:MAG: diaminohydroxyphosphoribosylaminopyrimidine deaminase, partial [Actinomycetota bacterium]|nr:diaminohydroxyphosphoribosylaminopyrimidine deaminase [Actinomycetota bacterium]
MCRADPSAASAASGNVCPPTALERRDRVQRAARSGRAFRGRPAPLNPAQSRRSVRGCLDSPRPAPPPKTSTSGHHRRGRTQCRSSDAGWIRPREQGRATIPHRRVPDGPGAPTATLSNPTRRRLGPPIRPVYLRAMPVRRTSPAPQDLEWMARAVELARLCETEPGKAKPSPRVGAVAVTANGEFLAEAHRGALNPGDHAEYCMIAQLGERVGALAGATVYTTLEPCTQRNPPNVPCVELLIAEGVAIVYIGMLDPDARIRELGWRAL